MKAIKKIDMHAHARPFEHIAPSMRAMNPLYVLARL